MLHVPSWYPTQTRLPAISVTVSGKEESAPGLLLTAGCVLRCAKRCCQQSSQNRFCLSGCFTHGVAGNGRPQSSQLTSDGACCTVDRRSLCCAAAPFRLGFGPCDRCGERRGGFWAGCGLPAAGHPPLLLPANPPLLLPHSAATAKPPPARALPSQSYSCKTAPGLSHSPNPAALPPPAAGSLRL